MALEFRSILFLFQTIGCSKISEILETGDSCVLGDRIFMGLGLKMSYILDNFCPITQCVAGDPIFHAARRPFFFIFALHRGVSHCACVIVLLF